MDNLETASNREAEQGVGEQDVDQTFLSYTRDAYSSSTSYMDSSLRNQWERNLDMFNSRHSKGSKYRSTSYKGRSRLFRPKTRAAVRKSEAAVAAAFFSTEDVTDIAPYDDSRPQNLLAAEVLKPIVNYRLTHTIPWFLTCMGGWQDARTMGVVISEQSWDYRQVKVGTETVTRKQPMVDPETGQQGYDPETGEPMFLEEVEENDVYEVVADKPKIRLIPAENLRIDPAADWTDPINSSPYVIELYPMYVADVRERITQNDSKTGQPEWKTVTDGQLAASKQPHMDSTRQAREGNDREDSKDANSSPQEFDVVWVYRNFIRIDGQDWFYLTLTDQALLTDPVPVEDVYRHLPRGERPIVMGYGVVETHKTYPTAPVALTGDIQQEVNETANLRLDGVRLAINGRYFVRSGKNVDIESLKRSISGSVTQMSDPEKDVVWHQPSSPAGSAFAEQDRLNAEFDELSGNFSAGSVQTNRQLNETVGGMGLLNAAADSITDYDIRVFKETWVEPVLRQLVRLEQAYETNEVILAIAGQKAGIEGGATDQTIQGDMVVSVNVGIGSTNPTQKLMRFQMGAKTIGEILGDTVKRQVDAEEVIKEVFGNLGYRDGMRFFKFEGQDPMVLALQDKVDELQKALEMKQVEQQRHIKVAEINANADIEEQRMEEEGATQRLMMEQRHDAMQAFRNMVMQPPQGMMPNG